MFSGYPSCLIKQYLMFLYLHENNMFGVLGLETTTTITTKDKQHHYITWGPYNFCVVYLL